MSYPSEDRHERDVVSGPARNPTQDMEKHDKSKVLTANPGGIFLFLYSLTVILCVFDTLPSPVRLKRLYEPFFEGNIKQTLQHFCKSISSCLKFRSNNIFTAIN